MNESTLTQLKKIVERAVRPVSSSNRHRRRIREELLNHVTAAFEEELGTCSDETIALDRTAARFGSAAELSAELSRSVPARDRLTQIVDNLWARRGESPFRRALRRAVVIELLIPVIPLLCWYAATAGNPRRLPIDALLRFWPQLIGCFLAVFVFMLLADWMTRAFSWEGDSNKPFVINAARMAIPCALVCAAIHFYFDRMDIEGLLLAAAFGALWVPFALSSLAFKAALREREEQEWSSLAV